MSENKMEIEIVSIPLSREHPPSICQEWLGCKIPVPDDTEIRKDGGGGLIKEDCYVVKISDAITSLRNAGRNKAASYWEKYKQSHSRFLIFKFSDVTLTY
jgi:hypothetical protein